MAKTVTIPKWAQSSQGVNKIKLRITSLAPLLIPLLDRFIELPQGVEDDVMVFVNALAIVAAGVLHAWGWIRARYSQWTGEE